MVLDDLVKGKLLIDYETVTQKMYRILATGENREVADRDYLGPSLTGVCPISDNEGEFRYYSRIREAIEEVFTTGEITPESLPPRAPIYWNSLLRRR